MNLFHIVIVTILSMFSAEIFSQELDKYGSNWDVIKIQKGSDFSSDIYSPILNGIEADFTAYIESQKAAATASSEARKKYQDLLKEFNNQNKASDSYLDRPVSKKNEALRSKAAKKLGDLNKESRDLRNRKDPSQNSRRYEVESDRLQITRSLLNREVIPYRFQRKGLLDIAESALNFYKSFKNDEFDGDIYLTVAGSLIDLSLGIVADVPINFYQAATGKEFLTERELSDLERGISIVNVLSAGISAKGGRVLKAVNKIADSLPDALKKSKRGLEIAEKVQENAYKRAGFSKGKWLGDVGNSQFLPDNTRALELTGGKGVPYRDGFVDFSEFALKSRKFDDLTGDANGDKLKYLKSMVADGEANTPEEARQLLRGRAIEIHHVEDGKTLQEVPAILHQEAKHTGGAAVLRALKGLVDDGDGGL